MPGDGEMAPTDVAMMSRELLSNAGVPVNNPYEEVTGPNPAAEIVGFHACTNPDDAVTTVGTDDRLNIVESVTGIVPPDVATITSGADERLKTVDRVTGIVPPDDATITSGVLLSVTMPLESDVGLLSTTVGLLDSVNTPLETFTVGALEKVIMPLLRLVGELSTTVGLLLSVTVPLLSERMRFVTVTAVLMFVTVTAVEGFVTVTAVLGLAIVASTPPLLVTTASAVLTPSPITITWRCCEEVTMTVSTNCPLEPTAGGSCRGIRSELSW